MPATLSLSARASAICGFIMALGIVSTSSSAGTTIIVLLCGGDKGSQAKDIKAAKRLASEWSE